MDERENNGRGPALFCPDRLVATVGAIAALTAAGVAPLSLVSRHLRGDWGDLADEDRQENERALVEGSRLLSCYRLKVGETVETVWVVTEADRSATTLLLPEEY